MLCEETDNYKVWQLKRDRLPDDFVSLFEYFEDAEQLSLGNKPLTLKNLKKNLQ